MICKRCGKTTLIENAKFCMFCGNSFVNESPYKAGMERMLEISKSKMKTQESIDNSNDYNSEKDKEIEHKKEDENKKLEEEFKELKKQEENTKEEDSDTIKVEIDNSSSYRKNKEQKRIKKNKKETISIEDAKKKIKKTPIVNLRNEKKKSIGLINKMEIKKENKNNYIKKINTSINIETLNEIIKEAKDENEKIKIQKEKEKLRREEEKRKEEEKKRAEEEKKRLEEENKRKEDEIRKRVKKENEKIKNDPIESSNNLGVANNISSVAKEDISPYDEIRNKITEEENIIQNLYPLALKSSRGYRSLFISKEGTKKDEIIERIYEFLKEKEKIDSLEYVAFANLPEKFDLRTFYVVTDFSTALYHLFNLEDFSEEASKTQLKYKNLLERLISADSNAYIVCSLEEQMLRSFYNLDIRLSYIFENKIFFKDLNFYDIYNEFKNNVQFEFDFNDEFKDYFYKYLDNNIRYMPFKNKKLSDFLSSYVNRRGEMILPEDKIDKNKNMEDFFSGIYGLENIKEEIRKLDVFLRSKNRLENQGVKFPNFNLHMMFLGNPGCGKTTLARYVGKILFERGFLRENKFIEATSKDMVAGALTGVKTSKLLQKSMGGVLFIDEAYSLVDCGQAGAEAIAILIKAMEDNKDDLVVMLAGYTREMGDFRNSNSGIDSRIAYTFKFEDYTPEELYEIYKIKLKNTGMELKKEDEEIMKDLLLDLMQYATARTNSGNGRFVDRLLQNTLINHAKNANGSGKINKTIVIEDIPSLEDISMG